MPDNKEQIRFIFNELDVSAIVAKLPPRITEMIDQMEQADREDNFPVYVQVSDDFEVFTKHLVPDVISMKEWRLLCEKYSIPPD